MSARVGIGFDAHRLAAGRKLVLGGVEIPHDRGLEGHSDGDVLLHALSDALLGAIAAPDLGSLFPSAGEEWRGASSVRFVEEALTRVRGQGFRVENVDLVIVAEEPRLAPHAERIRARVAEILGVPVSSVGLKSKTTDGLGFTGRKEGIAAHAVALLSPL